MYPEAVLSAISYEGVPMGIPGDASRGFFIVNKALYDQYNVPLPKTYEEFREGGKVFIENGIIPLATGFKDGNPGHHWFSILLNQLPGGTEEFNDMMVGKIHPESGNIAKVAQIIQEDADLGMYPKDFINGDWNTQQTLFLKEKQRQCTVFLSSFKTVRKTLYRIARCGRYPRLTGQKGTLSRFIPMALRTVLWFPRSPLTILQKEMQLCGLLISGLDRII